MSKPVKRIIRAEQRVAAPNGAKGEGLWALEIPEDPPVAIEVRVVPIGDVKGEKWRAVGGRSETILSGSGATPELAMADLVEGYVYRQTHDTPRVAITRHMLAPDDPVRVLPLARPPVDPARADG